MPLPPARVLQPRRDSASIMVSVTTSAPEVSSKSRPSDEIVAGLGESERATVRRALAYAGELYADRVLGTGESTWEHGLGLAQSLAALRLDSDTRIAGLLFAVPEYVEDSEDKITAGFGAVVASLVAG